MKKNKALSYEKGVSQVPYEAFFLEDGLFDMASYESHVVSHLRSGGALLGSDGAFTVLIKRILERALEAELDVHLSQDTEQDNRRNGSVTKTLRSVAGEIEISRSRDRNGTFEPQIVKPWSRELSSDLHDQILHLYSVGNSYADIEEFVRSMYGVSVSETVIQKVISSIDEELQAWLSRPLERVYPAIWIDGMYYKRRAAGHTHPEVLYNVLGVNMKGERSVLGKYTCSGSESAKFWLHVLNDLKNRDVEEVFFMMSDNLKGLKETIAAAFPRTHHQLCIVHQLRNSYGYLSHKDMRKVIPCLKAIYKATNLASAEAARQTLEQDWGEKYPQMVNSWKNNWPQLSTYFDYGPEIRKLIYTTNFIENYHRQLRKVTKGKSAFPSAHALLRLVYLAQKHIQQKWKGPIQAWRIIQHQLRLLFEDRIKPEDLA